MASDTILAIIATVIGFLVKEGWELVKGHQAEVARRAGEERVKNTDAINTLTLALGKMETRLDSMIKIMEEIPLMRRELAEAKTRIRELNAKIDQ